MDKNPKNFQAILDWCKVHRPELIGPLVANRNNDAYILLLTVGFESGRQFQTDNASMPLDQPHLYLE